MLICIYRLLDPRDSLPHYIGATINPDQRNWAHLSNSEKRGKVKHAWVAELKALGLRPIFEAIEWVEEKQAYTREIYWIKFGHDHGWPLTNIQRYSNCQRPEVTKDDLRAAADLLAKRLR